MTCACTCVYACVKHKAVGINDVYTGIYRAKYAAGVFCYLPPNIITASMSIFTPTCPSYFLLALIFSADEIKVK